ncbi:MAG: tRNA (N6-isopentenyl adenosine(37)-C2)-methylthiotransferase MiaB [Sandaracinaceae bacterium]
MRRYLVQTFGCQMNVHDSRRIEEVLDAAGWSATDEPTLADMVVFNTCSVREKAEHKLMSALGTVRPLKDQGRPVVLAVAGCVAQQEGVRLLKSAPYVDVVIGPDNIAELPGLALAASEGAAPIARTEFDVHAPSFLDATPRRDGSEVTAFVTVMKGCDERCTYCVVPYTRGPERYRSADDIVGEIRAMVAGGVREVTLLGQTVNSWFDPTRAHGASEVPPRWDAELARTSEFASLLRRIASEVPELERLRYTSPHPRHLTDDLILAHAELDVLAKHVHLPVQSGNDRVLKRMLRRYTRALYLERVAKLEDAVPGLTLSTDIIVGFPGETEAELEDTLSLIEQAGFVAAFGFKYSPRPHTPSRKLVDDVPEEEKAARLERVFEVVARQQSAHLASLVGSDVRVLIELRSRGDEGRFLGRSERNEIVHVLGREGDDLRGSIVTARVEQANRHSLMGRTPDAPERRASLRLPVVA